MVAPLIATGDRAKEESPDATSFRKSIDKYSFIMDAAAFLNQTNLCNGLLIFCI